MMNSSIQNTTHSLSLRREIMHSRCGAQIYHRFIKKFIRLHTKPLISVYFGWGWSRLQNNLKGMASNGYFLARDEFIDSLAQNADALEKLQKMYKLPEIYTTLPPERTVRALELIDVFSPQSPVGLLELPFWLGMKDTHKKIKRIMKLKKSNSFRYRGCNELHLNADLEQILRNVERAGRYFYSDLQLAQSVLQTRAAVADKTEKFIKTIPVITDLVKDVGDTMKDLANLQITLERGLDNSTDFCCSSKRKVNNEEGPPHPLIQPLSTGSDPLRRRQIEQAHTTQAMLPPQSRFEESWRKGPPSPLPPLPPKPSNSPRVIERVANKIDERKVMVQLGEPRIRMSRTFNDREAFDRLMAEEQRRKMALQQEKMIESRPLPDIPQPVMLYDDILNSPREISSHSYPNPTSSTNPFERGPIDTPNERGRVIIEQQNPFVQQKQFSVLKQQQFQMQVVEEQDFHNRQNPFFSRRDNFEKSSFDAPHSLELKTDDYERLRRSRMDRCESYVDMTNNNSSYVNVTVSNGVPVMPQPGGETSGDSDEETDMELFRRFPTEDDEDEENFPAEEYDSVGPSNSLSRSQLMQMRH
ncbi:PREDICTED: uncharacterized protein LOC109582839 isoform X2 [Amphimedon queenslandica]|uniref:Uncharacterized protein n=1 Tax=Amphimedon queenslandica TaxID=400682 RepID=A0AAN0J9K8_AMPQE|nr:PREDICTED: uncharacterized protein LOC109582839 isoform X2 [Amphimedon queenslandica]|eukprot:XP_019853388.1 PREDICTED: uncharacterized protein LOC109582839 isoform X2 [Amphimedon queenslandica]